MLDDVERRRFLVQPAGKDPLRAAVGALHIDLHERAGQFLFLPRRGRLARAQVNHHVLPPRRLAGPQGDIPDDAVALVEHPEHRDALGHRRDPGLILVGARGPAARGRRILVLSAAAASGEAEREQQWRGGFQHLIRESTARNRRSRRAAPCRCRARRRGGTPPLCRSGSPSAPAGTCGPAATPCPAGRQSCP